MAIAPFLSYMFVCVTSEWSRCERVLICGNRRSMCCLQNLTPLRVDWLNDSTVCSLLCERRESLRLTSRRILLLFVGLESAVSQSVPSHSSLTHYSPDSFSLVHCSLSVSTVSLIESVSGVLCCVVYVWNCFPPAPVKEEEEIYKKEVFSSSHKPFSCTTQCNSQCDKVQILIQMYKKDRPKLSVTALLYGTHNHNHWIQSPQQTGQFFDPVFFFSICFHRETTSDKQCKQNN